MSPSTQEKETTMEIDHTDLDADDNQTIETNIELGTLNYPGDDDPSLETIVHGIKNFTMKLKNNPHTCRLLGVYATTNFGELQILQENREDKIKSGLPSHLLAASILKR